MSLIQPEYLVAIDVGNTRVKFGLFRICTGRLPEVLQITACVPEEPVPPQQRLVDWLKTDCSGHIDSLGQVQRILIAGSDPETRDRLIAGWPVALQQPEVVSGYQQVPIGLDVDRPDRVGIDRLLNVWAAWNLSGRKSAVIAVDSGTATTVDLLSADGVFRGGSILPGLRLSAYAMHDYTARLPLLNMDHEITEPPELPGRNTEAAMRAGLFYGQLGAVRELAAGLTQHASRLPGGGHAPSLYVSGGGGRQLVRYLPGALFVDSLALHGLAQLASDQARPGSGRIP